MYMALSAELRDFMAKASFLAINGVFLTWYVIAKFLAL